MSETLVDRIDDCLKYRNLKRLALCEAVGITTTAITHKYNYDEYFNSHKKYSELTALVNELKTENDLSDIKKAILGIVDLLCEE